MPDAVPTLSLWIVPPSPLRETLREIVTRFARIAGMPPFEPHVTLLGDLVGSPPEILRDARGIAAAGAFEVQCDGIGTGPTFFRSVFLRVHRSEGILEARGAAGRLLGGRAARPEEPFDPHLSLAYGALEEEVRGAVLDEVERRGLGTTTFRADRITLARSSSGIPIEEWRMIGELDLGSRP